MNFVAFHGEQAVKDKVVERVLNHERAGEFLQYGEGDGSFSGVALRTVGGREDSLYETELGIPVALARLEEVLFQNMAPLSAKKFPSKFLASIPLGADLSDVSRRFAVWHLSDPVDGVIQFASADITTAVIQAVADAYERAESDPAVWMELRDQAIQARTDELCVSRSPRAIFAAGAAVHSAMSGALAAGHMDLPEDKRKSVVATNAAKSAELTILAHAAPSVAVDVPARRPLAETAKKRGVRSYIARAFGKDRSSSKALTPAESYGSFAKSSARGALDRNRIEAVRVANREIARQEAAVNAAQKPARHAAAARQAEKLIELLMAAPVPASV